MGAPSPSAKALTELVGSQPAWSPAPRCDPGAVPGRSDAAVLAASHPAQRTYVPSPTTSGDSRKLCRRAAWPAKPHCHDLTGPVHQVQLLASSKTHALRKVSRLPVRCRSQNAKYSRGSTARAARSERHRNYMPSGRFCKQKGEKRRVPGRVHTRRGPPAGRRTMPRRRPPTRHRRSVAPRPTRPAPLVRAGRRASRGRPPRCRSCGLAALGDVQLQFAELLLVPADQLAERDGQTLGRVVVHYDPLVDLEDDLRLCLLLLRLLLDG